MIGALRYFVTEAAMSLWRGRRSSILSVLTITIALFMLGLFVLTTTNLERVVAEWSRSAEFSVYVHDGATAAERGAIEGVLEADPSVAAVDFVSKEEALGRFRRDFPELAPATAGSSDNPFPASFEVRLASRKADGASLDRLAGRVGRMAGVADVRYDRRWLDRLASLTAFIRWAGLLLSGILIIAAAFTVSNVVRLALIARRDEIEIMELVGAPMVFIRGPFVVEGILQGGLGAAIAIAALWTGLGLARPRLAAAAAGLFEPSAVEFLSLGAASLVLLGGAMVGCIGGLMAARRLH